VYNETDIEAVHGPDQVAYARNKNRGGRSSAKGRDYELIYAAYRIAVEAKEVLDRSENGSAVVFQDQILCFIDDLVADVRGTRILEQMKSGQANWGGVAKSVAGDFRLQDALDQAMGIDARYRLVVGDKQVAETLLTSRPKDLAYVEVAHFPASTNDRELIAAKNDLREALDALSCRRPEPIVREQVFRTLLAGWCLSTGPQSVADIVNRAAEGPNGLLPPMLPDYALADNVRAALDAIPNLSYTITRNVFRYACGMMTGYANYHCHTTQFGGFAEAIVNERPADFPEFFALMRRHL